MKELYDVVIVGGGPTALLGQPIWENAVSLYVYVRQEVNAEEGLKM